MSKQSKQKWQSLPCSFVNGNLFHVSSIPALFPVDSMKPQGKVFHAFVDELLDEDDETDSRHNPTPTENLRVPFSVYMEG